MVSKKVWIRVGCVELWATDVDHFVFEVDGEGGTGWRLCFYFPKATA